MRDCGYKDFEIVEEDYGSWDRLGFETGMGTPAMTVMVLLCDMKRRRNWTELWRVFIMQLNVFTGYQTLLDLQREIPPLILCPGALPVPVYPIPCL